MGGTLLVKEAGDDVQSGGIDDYIGGGDQAGEPPGVFATDGELVLTNAGKGLSDEAQATTPADFGSPASSIGRGWEPSC